ncbi:hypothetical protein BaRGS_00025404 [Batillaria attramentaria]|uniref:Tc1-like transposase DDE domain-containing protein n=1 Tax=Batillaria attramentaria TaxID=370345 RepID=A0ABD0K8E3_9CAEN
MEDNESTAGEGGEQHQLVSRRLCHMAKGASWCGAGCDGGDRTPLVMVDGNLTAQRYIDQIIRPVVLPYLQQQPHGVLYQQDTAPPHTASVVHHVLAANVNVLPWPARSPDSVNI